MSYISLYRKYRPTSFKNLLGQENITSILINAVKNDKISHAYLFNGSRGTGKTSTAKILSKNICCENKKDGQSCDECASCLSIINKKTMDIIELDGASNNGVEEVKRIIENVHYAPTSLSHKIYIIDEVHMLSNSAFNALLKTIEEPPSHVVFILATTEVHKIPATILSRCQRFDFKKLSINDLKATISRVLRHEDIRFEDAAIAKIAYLANGGARDALSITDKIMNYSVDIISEKQVCEIFGIADNSTKIRFLNLIFSDDASSLLNEIEKIFNSGIDLIRFNNSLLITLKDLLIFKQTNSDQFCEIFKIEELKQIKLSKQQVLKLIDIFLSAQEQMKSNEDTRFSFQIACMESIKELNEYIQPTITVKPEAKKSEIIYDTQPIEQETIKKDNILESKTTDAVIEKDSKKVIIEFKEEPVKVKSLPKPTIDEIINLILQIDRRQLEIDSTKLQNPELMILNEKYDPFMSALKDGKLMGATQTALLFVFDHEVQSELVNSMRGENNFIELLKIIYGDYKQMYATNKKEVIQIKAKIISYGESKPETTPIKPLLPTEEKNPKLEFAKDIFGESLEIQ